MSKQSIGIIGFGEVGKAIYELAKGKFNVFTRDLKFDEIAGQSVNILNICIPYNQKFEEIVVDAIKEIKPELVIIHATIKPGTTRKIYHQTKIPIAHTPIMGVHPNLAKYQKVFTKVIGAIDDKTFMQVKKFWLQLGAKKIEKFDRPEESEMAKILCTTYYGWNIVFNKAVGKLADKYDMNFDQIYTKFSQIYNAGYEKSLPHVRRPILKHMPGAIGGHCVLPNAAFMQEEDDLFKEFMRLTKKFS